MEIKSWFYFDSDSTPLNTDIGLPTSLPFTILILPDLKYLSSTTRLAPSLPGGAEITWAKDAFWCLFLWPSMCIRTTSPWLISSDNAYLFLSKDNNKRGKISSWYTLFVNPIFFRSTDFALFMESVKIGWNLFSSVGFIQLTGHWNLKLLLYLAHQRTESRRRRIYSAEKGNATLHYPP